MWELKSLALSTIHVIGHLYSKCDQMNCVSDIVKEYVQYLAALLFITCNVLLSCDNLFLHVFVTPSY